MNAEGILPSKIVTVNHLRNLVLCSALALSLGSCVFVPLDYYEPPPPTRYMQGDPPPPPPPRYRDRYEEDRYSDRWERRAPRRRDWESRDERYYREESSQTRRRDDAEDRGRGRERDRDRDLRSDPTADEADPAGKYRPSNSPDSGRTPDMRGIENPKPAPKPADLPETSATKPSSTPNPNANAPTATRSAKPGRVKSPFAPYNELDVSGMQSGSLAKDPSNGKVFRVP